MRRKRERQQNDKIVDKADKQQEEDLKKRKEKTFCGIITGQANNELKSKLYMMLATKRK